MCIASVRNLVSRPGKLTQLKTKCNADKIPEMYTLKSVSKRRKYQNAHQTFNFKVFAIGNLLGKISNVLPAKTSHIRGLC